MTFTPLPTGGVRITSTQGLTMSWPITYNYPVPVDYVQIMVHNVGPQTLYLGGTKVSSASGLPITPGSVVQVPIAPTLTGMTLSIATDGQYTLPKPKPTLGDHISDARKTIEKLPASHARTIALHALTEASLWATEASK